MGGGGGGGHETGFKDYSRRGGVRWLQGVGLQG